MCKVCDGVVVYTYNNNGLYKYVYDFKDSSILFGAYILYILVIDFNQCFGVVL